MPDFPFRITLQDLQREGQNGVTPAVREALNRLRAELPENASFDVLDPLVRAWMESTHALPLFEALSEAFSGHVTVHLQNAFNLARGMASVQSKPEVLLGLCRPGFSWTAEGQALWLAQSAFEESTPPDLLKKIWASMEVSERSVLYRELARVDDHEDPQIAIGMLLGVHDLDPNPDTKVLAEGLVELLVIRETRDFEDSAMDAAWFWETFAEEFLPTDLPEAILSRWSELVENGKGALCAELADRCLSEASGPVQEAWMNRAPWDLPRVRAGLRQRVLASAPASPSARPRLRS